MIECGFVSRSVSTERHFSPVNYEQEIKCVNQRTFPDIVWSDDLKRIAVVKFNIGFGVNIGI